VDRYWDRVALAVIVLVVLGAVLRQCWSGTGRQKQRSPSRVVLSSSHSDSVTITGGKRDPRTVYDYILSVIAHGSHRLDFPGGEMEGGYLKGLEARKAACYVMSLRGEKCPDQEAAEGGAMYYTSVCGGCHGNDAKGLHGSFPDLTRPILLGIQE